MKILVAYRAIPGRPGWATGDYVVKALRALGHDAQPYAKVYQHDEWLPSQLDGEPDLLLYLECNDADDQYTELVERRCPKVYWEFDTSMHLEGSVTLVQFMGFARVFTANRLLAPQLRWGYLPYAVDLDSFACLDGFDGRATGGVGLVGSPFKERVAFCHEAGVPLVVGKYDDDYLRAIASLRVHVHHYASGGQGLIVYRPFETLACGTCLLAERDESLEQLWVPGVHYMSYDSPAECREKAAWLLAHDEERERIARAGRHSIEQAHTYEHRCKTILAAVGA